MIITHICTGTQVQISNTRAYLFSGLVSMMLSISLSHCTLSSLRRFSDYNRLVRDRNGDSWVKSNLWYCLVFQLAETRIESLIRDTMCVKITP